MDTAGRLSTETWTAKTIAAIGTDAFGDSLDQYLSSICRVDFSASYCVRADSVTPLSSSDPARFGSAARIALYTRDELWISDPALRNVRTQLRRNNFAHARLSKSDLPQGQLLAEVYPHLVDRILLCHQGNSGAFALSLLRWNISYPFQQQHINQLLAASPVIFALIGQHYAASATKISPADALSSVELIRRCLVESTEMPQRELEVCSHLLVGDTVSDTARELQIGSETVRSYVKRAYHRLGVNSQRELMVAYLKLWHAWSQRERVITKR